MKTHNVVIRSASIKTDKKYCQKGCEYLESFNGTEKGGCGLFDILLKNQKDYSAFYRCKECLKIAEDK